MSDPRRRIPSVDGLVEDGAFAGLRDRFGRERVVDALRSVMDRVRDDLARDNLARDDMAWDGGSGEGRPLVPSDRLDEPSAWTVPVRSRLEAADRPSLRRVINATGVVLHTNLGRAPLARAARDALSRIGDGYANLEYDLAGGHRGSRYVHCTALVRELTGAGDALVVNNNAAALVLALNTLARGRSVVVSRGELVEIGGGFRIPEMLERAGCHLVEVGSTNRTRPADYGQALEALATSGEGSGAGLILKVHRSNFRMSGFTEEASLQELAAVAERAGVPLVHDLGSGLLADPSTLGLPFEPRPGESLRAGADVVCFSGDKLLGGPQAGILAGAAAPVEAMRRNPLCRALRVDKGTLAALEATLRLYRDPEDALRQIPVLAMLSAPVGEVEDRARRAAERLSGEGLTARAAPGTSMVGGGTYPGVEIPSWTVRIRPAAGSADGLLAALRTGDPPVVGRAEEGEAVLDLRTVAPEEQDAVIGAVLAAAAASPPTRDAPGGGDAPDAPETADAPRTPGEEQ